MYVRVLAEDAVERGANVQLVLAPGIRGSAAFQVHLNQIAGSVSITEALPSFAALED